MPTAGADRLTGFAGDYRRSDWASGSLPLHLPRSGRCLGSCVGVVLYDRTARLGGLAHIVLPKAHGTVDHPGKYADTAIPALIAEFDRGLEAKYGRA